MDPNDFPPLPPGSLPAGYPVEQHDISEQSAANDHLVSLFPHNAAADIEAHRHEGVPLLPTYRELEESNERIGEIFNLIENEPLLRERIQRIFLDKQEQFINYILVKKAGGLKFQPSLSDKDKEDRLVELGLQFLRTDTLEWQMDFASFLDLSLDASSSASGVSDLDFTVALLNTLGHAGSIFLMGIHLSKGKEVLEAKRKALLQITDPDERAKLESEIETLKIWVESNTNIVKQGLKSEAMAFALSTPKLISSLASLIAGTGTTTAAVFDWLGLGVDLIGSGFRLRKAHSDRKHYTQWAEAFKGTTLTPDKMDEVLDKQKSGHERKLALNTPKLEAKTREILQGQFDGKDFSSMKKELEELGWTIPDEVSTPDELEAFIQMPDHKAAANENMVKKSEGVSASLRNAFRALAAKKASIDAGFVKLRLNRSRGLFTTATLLTGLLIALKVAVLLGVAIAAGALVFTGYGMLVAIAGAIVVGAVYLRVKKPNLFKEHWKGVKTKLLFRKIPQIIQNFRLQRTTMESSKLATSLLVKNLHKKELELLLETLKSGDKAIIPDELKNRVKALKNVKNDRKLEKILSKALEDLNRKIDQEKARFDNLQKKIDELGESVKHHEAKAKVLQKRIENAGWKDYLWHLNKEHGGAYNEEIIDILAEHLMSDSDLLDDPDTRELLEHLGINLSEVRELHDANSRLGEVADAIRSFFGSEDDEVIRKIRERKMVVAYGKS